MNAELFLSHERKVRVKSAAVATECCGVCVIGKTRSQGKLKTATTTTAFRKCHLLISRLLNNHRQHKNNNYDSEAIEALLVGDRPFMETPILVVSVDVHFHLPLSPFSGSDSFVIQQQIVI
uniref:Uncharacterized protein n=1 Tax=Musca domestica TaxID=7370 RepID=A0A1I8NIV4_MUSDO